VINSGDLRTLANGLFPSGGSEAHLTPEGRDEIRDAIDVILKFWDYRNTKLSLALEQLDRAADEIFRLRAEKDKLVEALAQALANCGALRSPALPSEEEIARVIIRTCEDVGENEDEFCSDRMALASARAVLTLIAKSKGCT
jgi:hypothetical protein